MCSSDLNPSKASPPLNEFSVQVRPCRVCVLRDDETLDVGGRSAVGTVRLFHVQYYETHIFFLSFLACETINLTIFEGGKMPSSKRCAEGLAPCLIGEFSAIRSIAARKIP